MIRAAGIAALALGLALAGCERAQGPSLAQLCEKHATDKCAFGHNYVELYETLLAPLRARELRILEIGVAQGYSLLLWQDYFPRARIYGVDIQPKKHLDNARTTTLVADQGKRADLARVLQETGGKFDLVIDDGGHRMEQQQLSLGLLFPALAPGGLYIIEDVHTSFPDSYPGFGVEPGGANSTYALIDGFVRTGAIRSRYLSAQENAALTAGIAACGHFFRATKARSQLVWCRKK